MGSIVDSISKLKSLECLNQQLFDSNVNWHIFGRASQIAYFLANRESSQNTDEFQ